MMDDGVSTYHTISTEQTEMKDEHELVSCLPIPKTGRNTIPRIVRSKGKAYVMVWLCVPISALRSGSRVCAGRNSQMPQGYRRQVELDRLVVKNIRLP